jgi:hypothetical protein
MRRCRSWNRCRIYRYAGKVSSTSAQCKKRKICKTFEGKAPGSYQLKEHPDMLPDL